MEFSEIGFADRLAFLRWLRNRGRVKAETDAELAAAWGVGEKWLGKWKRSHEAPEGRTEHRAIVNALGDAGDWLYDGTGAPPEQREWRKWLEARPAAATVVIAKPDIGEPGSVYLARVAKKTAAKKGDRGKKNGA